MTTYVEIAVNVPNISKIFHYHLPSELEGKVGSGHLVTVPFGRQTVQGIVLDIVEGPTIPKTKPVLELLDPDPVLTEAQKTLAYYISEQTLAPLAICINLMLPPGLGQMADTVYQSGITRDHFATGTQQGSLKLTDAQWRLLTLLIDRGPLRGRQIDRALPYKNWKATAEALKRRGLVTSQPFLNAPTVRPGHITYLSSRSKSRGCTMDICREWGEFGGFEEISSDGSDIFGRERGTTRSSGPVDLSTQFTAGIDR
jgi:primosomal protein N' (replication factor Y)